MNITMRIVVLDGHAANPGDLSWAPLEALGAVTIHARTRPEETLARARGAEILLTNKTLLSRAIIEQLPGLRYIGVLATGYNVVDVQAARERGIAVTNVPDYATESVAQLVIAHMLNLAMRVGEHAQSVRSGDWVKAPDFCYWKYPLAEMSGLTLGLVGLGSIGSAVARLGLGFKMRVLGAGRPGAARVPPAGVEAVDLGALFHESDVVSLHCPLTPATERLVNAERLACMRPTAWLINTGRGGLVDEAALASALNGGQLGGAGLDVLSTEPPTADNPLLTARNCFITPHFGATTLAARQRLLDGAVTNLVDFINGWPRHVVNT